MVFVSIFEPVNVRCDTLPVTKIPPPGNPGGRSCRERDVIVF
ncbi:hypothetical protein RMSM_06032 [Rhodopirellula maiorica SM1]|uniref:Uncharacterized protein n=1 Tax=Rhodopirellula maiorica SM1 TaxID=1265738 RepID=M5RCD8_9BACT|nr:hypothetical protein RMSM_06032 [Rhodopirellula maiorica SM1]